MMPIDCKCPGDVSVYLLSNLHRPFYPEEVIFKEQTWQLCLVYRWDLHHLNLYSNADDTSFAFHAGCCWTGDEPPNLGVHLSMGFLIDFVSNFMWNVWGKNGKRHTDDKNRSSDS